jgi:hypothetical protein
MTTVIYRNLNLRLVRNVKARLDVATLRRVTPQGTTIPAALITATNCCWVNVWITTLAAMGVRLSAADAADLMRRITAAGSRMMSPLDMGDLVTGVNLPVTFIEYSQRNQVGWSIGTPNGPPVAFVNTGTHYEICLPVGSDLAQRFATPVTPTRSWSTGTKGKPRSNAARRRAETKGIVKATAGARKRPSTAGACEVKAVSTTTSMPTPVRQPGVSQWWGRGGEPAVINPTHTKTFAQAESADRSLALQIAAEDRVIADSIEDETRRLAKLSLDLANQMDADARMARELSNHLNGL